jgi:preprotein translocase subunit SecG
MQNVLLAAEVLVAVALIFIVLLQRSEGGGLGMGSGNAGGAGLFSPRGAADTLTRTTAVLAFLFIVICIGLNIIALRGRPESATSILDTPASTSPAKPAAPPVPAPTAPSVPKPQ